MAISGLTGNDRQAQRLTSGCPRIFGGEVGAPTAIASDGTHVWVADSSNNSLVELSATSGRLVRMIYVSTYGFDYPDAVFSEGGQVFVANRGSNSITKPDAPTGALARLISAPRDGFSEPVALTADGTHLWVLNAGGSVTELSESTGALGG